MPVVRKNHRGAYRTALGYVLVVMGGTFLVVTPAFNLLASGGDRFHPYAHPSVLAVLGFNVKLFFRVAGSPAVALWLFAGALVYLCALLLQKLKIPLLSRLILAAVSAYLSCKIVFFVAPVGWPSLAAVYFTILGVGFFWGRLRILRLPADLRRIISDQPARSRALGSPQRLGALRRFGMGLHRLCSSQSTHHE